MRYTKSSFPNIDNIWITPYGYMNEEEMELYLFELNNGVYE